MFIFLLSVLSILLLGRAKLDRQNEVQVGVNTEYGKQQA
jgi:hypothetical protein